LGQTAQHQHCWKPTTGSTLFVSPRIHYAVKAWHRHHPHHPRNGLGTATTLGVGLGLDGLGSIHDTPHLDPPAPAADVVRLLQHHPHDAQHGREVAAAAAKWRIREREMKSGK